MSLPLEGIKVIDLSRIIAGPFCTQYLADMGAEVIKIEERDAGDPLRRQGVIINGESWYFVNLNRNKKSMTLNLRTDEGKEIFRKLAKTADVVVENFRPNVMERLGLDYERLKEINPRIIYCGITGFGKTGPYRDRPAFDFIAQGLSGFMSLNGFPDGEPVRTGIAISDTIAGIFAAAGILTAIIERERSGVGQEVQTSLVEGLIGMFTFAASNYLASGKIPQRCGNDHPIVYPYGSFRTKDGVINIAATTEVIYERLVRALGLDHMLEDPRFENNDKRMQHKKEIKELFEKVLTTNTTEYWIEYLNDKGVPAGPIYDLRQAFDDPQIKHQQMVLEVDQPSGKVKVVGFPVKLSRTPASIHLPSPALGQHTEEILSEIGYSKEEIEKLRERKVI